MDSTLLKGLNVLEQLVNSAEPLGVTALASSLGLPKSNIHRTLMTLIAAGFVAQNNRGAYHPTLRIWQQGMQVMARHPVRRAAFTFMQSLQQDTSETINLIVPDGDNCIYIDQLVSARPLRMGCSVGERVPQLLTVSGRAMLAHHPDAGQRANQLYAAQNPQPPFRLSELLAELESIRQEGIGMSASIWRPGINSMAAVILGPQKLPVGAIAIAGSKSRFTDDRMRKLAQPLMNVCTSISRTLGA